MPIISPLSLIEKLTVGACSSAKERECQHAEAINRVRTKLIAMHSPGCPKCHHDVDLRNDALSIIEDALQDKDGFLMAKDMPKGFSCECGAYHKFGVYVAAHWNDSLTHTCDCGRQHEIRYGHARYIRGTPKKKKEPANG